jgi:hypothetical protein
VCERERETDSDRVKMQVLLLRAQRPSAISVSDGNPGQRHWAASGTCLNVGIRRVEDISENMYVPGRTCTNQVKTEVKKIWSGDRYYLAMLF